MLRWGGCSSKVPELYFKKSYYIYMSVVHGMIYRLARMMLLSVGRRGLGLELLVVEEPDNRLSVSPSTTVAAIDARRRIVVTRRLDIMEWMQDERSRFSARTAVESTEISLSQLTRTRIIIG